MPYGSTCRLAAVGLAGRAAGGLAARTGRVRRTIPVGTAPVGVGVDAPTGRAYLSDRDAAVVTVVGR